jgi:hypothetical protein
MTEKDLTQLGLLEEFSITELEQRLEFEAWCDDCSCTDNCPNTASCPDNTVCPPIDGYCGGGGGGGGTTDDTCIIDVVQP